MSILPPTAAPLVPTSNATSPPPPPQQSLLTPPSPIATSPDGSTTNSVVESQPSSLSTGLVGLTVGLVLGGTFVLIGVGIYVIWYRRRKKKKLAQNNYGGPSSSPHPQVPKVDPLHRQQNAPQVTILPIPTPPPGIASNPHSSLVNVYPSAEPPSTSSSLDSEKLPSASTSPGIGLGFPQSTFSFEELSSATNGFSDANLIGQGGFGYVHKGVLPNGKMVAIKQLKAGSGQGEREFQAEVEIISRVHHRHLVSLVGYCITGEKRLLVYEFVPNNTLEFHLHGKERAVMSWKTRMRIALGAAKGLAYLHEDCRPKIIHRDIKAPNILLDESFEAKVADFGLAKYSLDTDTHISTRVMGTFGYLAPEYASTGKLTEKSDVFSFGVVLLEMITGRRPVEKTQEESMVDWARPLMSQALETGNFDALADPRLEEDYESSEMARMIACAAACVRHLARLRPQMSQIVRALEGNLALDDLNRGMTPGYSTAFSSLGSLDYSTTQYKEDLKKFRKMALETRELASSEYSGLTSEYGVNPSTSSTDGQPTTQEIELPKTEKETKDSVQSS
ncbi:hypothetical protein SLE2022_383050 [Rubroshorea leprosula]